MHATPSRCSSSIPWWASNFKLPSIEAHLRSAMDRDLILKLVHFVPYITAFTLLLELSKQTYSHPGNPMTDCFGTFKTYLVTPLTHSKPSNTYVSIIQDRSKVGDRFIDFAKILNLNRPWAKKECPSARSLWFAGTWTSFRLWGICCPSFASDYLYIIRK